MRRFLPQIALIYAESLSDQITLILWTKHNINFGKVFFNGPSPYARQLCENLRDLRETISAIPQIYAEPRG